MLAHLSVQRSQCTQNAFPLSSRVSDWVAFSCLSQTCCSHSGTIAMFACLPRSPWRHAWSHGPLQTHPCSLSSDIVPCAWKLLCLKKFLQNLLLYVVSLLRPVASFPAWLDLPLTPPSSPVLSHRPPGPRVGLQRPGLHGCHRQLLFLAPQGLLPAAL